MGVIFQHFAAVMICRFTVQFSWSSDPLSNTEQTHYAPDD